MFSSSILRSFPQLWRITIRECDQLVQIIEEDEKDKSLSNYHSQQVCFPSLAEIDIRQCNNLKYLFTVSSSNEIPLLRGLLIEECSLLYNVFAPKESENEDGQAIMLPKLQMLRLTKLPNLISISEGFKLQSVRDHKVEDCPKLTLTTTAPSEVLPQEYQNPVEEEDKESKKEEEHKGEEVVKLGNMNVIEQSATNCPESKEAHKVQSGTPSMDGTSLSATTASGLREANAVQQDMIEVPSQTALTNPKEGNNSDLQTLTNQDVNLSAPIAATNKKYQVPEEGSNQNKMEDKNPLDAQESVQEQNINFREKFEQKLMSTKEAAKERHQKGPTPDKSTEATSSLDLVVKEPTGKLDRQEGLEQNQLSNECLDRTGVTQISQSSSFLVYPGDMPSGLDLNKATETIMDFPIQWGDSYQGPRNDGKIKHHLDNLNSVVSSSGEAPPELPPSVPVAQNVHDTIPAVIPVKAPMHALAPQVNLPMSSTGKFVTTFVEEYANFREIGAIKKRHIPLLEQALASHPSLQSWHEKFRHPEVKKFGYNMLGNMLEFLTSTRWRDLTEEKKAEFESIVDVLEPLGFDIQWLGNIRARINQSKYDEETIDRMKKLELQVAAQEIKVEAYEVGLQMAKAELQKSKSEVDAIKAKLGNFNDFIGF